MAYRGRIGPETQLILKALAKLAPDYPKEFSSGIWIFRLYGKKFYRVFPINDFILMTGADITTQLPIPFAHKWIRTDFYHTTLDPTVASTQPLLISIQRRAGIVEPIAAFVEYLLHEENIRHAEIGENWGENFEYESTTWDLILNSDANDHIYPIFAIERLDE